MRRLFWAMSLAMLSVLICGLFGYPVCTRCVCDIFLFLFHRYNDTIEPYNEMQAAISAYTTASVAISDGARAATSFGTASHMSLGPAAPRTRRAPCSSRDGHADEMLIGACDPMLHARFPCFTVPVGIGFSNASLIKMTCRSDGRLLHPTAPARAIDMSFALAGGPVPRTAHNHAVMSTFTDVGGARWPHVLVIGLNSSWSLSPAHLGDDIDPAKEHVVWSGYQAADTAGVGAAANITVRKLRFSTAAPIVLEPCGYADFGLWHAAPVFPASNAAFLGEVGKWVPISAARVRHILAQSSPSRLFRAGRAWAVHGHRALSSPVCASRWLIWC